MTRSGRLLAWIVLSAAVAGCASFDDRLSASRRRDTELAARENLRACELLDQRDYKQAQRHLLRALAADVMSGPARNNLGLAYYHQGKLYEAACEFQHAARLMPYRPEPRNNLGLVFERAGKLADAANSYSKARQLEPDNPQYLGNLARARVRAGLRDPETHQLLEELVLRETRDDWRNWAIENRDRTRNGTTPPATTRVFPERND